jgi:hypothetical protein
MLGKKNTAFKKKEGKAVSVEAVEAHRVVRRLGSHIFQIIGS